MNLSVLQLLTFQVSMFINYLHNTINESIDRSRIDPKFRNNILSQFYFFKDMGPGISAFCIPAMIYQHESALSLMLLLLLGIVMKQIARVLIEKYIALTKKRKDI